LVLCCLLSGAGALAASPTVVLLHPGPAYADSRFVEVEQRILSELSGLGLSVDEVKTAGPDTDLSSFAPLRRVAKERRALAVVRVVRHPTPTRAESPPPPAPDATDQSVAPQPEPVAKADSGEIQIFVNAEEWGREDRIPVESAERIAAAALRAAELVHTAALEITLPEPEPPVEPEPVPEPEPEPSPTLTTYFGTSGIFPSGKLNATGAIVGGIAARPFEHGLVEGEVLGTPIAARAAATTGGEVEVALVGMRLSALFEPWVDAPISIAVGPTITGYFAWSRGRQDSETTISVLGGSARLAWMSESHIGLALRGSVGQSIQKFAIELDSERSTIAADPLIDLSLVALWRWGAND
jgi:hypothetical protein